MNKKILQVTVKYTVDSIREEYSQIKNRLDEKSRRLWCAQKAIAIGYRGKTMVHSATEMDYKTINHGIQDLQDSEMICGEMVCGEMVCGEMVGDSITALTNKNRRIRKAGGGRESCEIKQPGLKTALEKLVSPSTRGDPENPLRWTSKSTGKLAKELVAEGFQITDDTVGSLLKKQGYSLQSNRKRDEGSKSPDRDLQFGEINRVILMAHENNCPTISVDTKKKENIGNFKNNGREYEQTGKPLEVNAYDFIDKNLGKVAPYGIYDIGKNNGFVSVGISSDTAEFAVNSIRSWWYNMGEKQYKEASYILITADCGGSNSSRSRLWKRELQKFANEITKAIHVHHFPPGTSKWNKIEHRMFSYISKNWRGKPLITQETVIECIAHTTTSTGLTIMAQLDNNTYEKGIKVSDEELSSVHLIPNEFHPEWNYTIACQKG